MAAEGQRLHCAYPAHREHDRVTEGGRVICTRCHPPHPAVLATMTPVLDPDEIPTDGGNDGSSDHP